MSADTAPASTGPIRVSILINNYNYRDFVEVAVRSALAQTHPVIEVIVVDDGSTDGSAVVLQGYGSRITLVMKANGGQGSAYNAGFARCTGDIVIFLDADDWLYPDAAAQIAAHWRPSLAKIQFPLTLVDRHGMSLQRRVPRNMSDESSRALVLRFGTYGSPPGSGNAYGAAFLRKVLPMDEARWRIAADTVPIVLAPMYGDLLSIPEPLGAYRLHRPADDASLLMNNAPADLWHEYERIDQSKRFVAAELANHGQAGKRRLMLAPWEARVATLCVRFGGMVPRRFGASGGGIFLFSFYSLWRWPHWSLRQKTVQSVWMLALIVLPRTLAKRAALRHKASVGLPAPPAETTGRV